MEGVLSGGNKDQTAFGSPEQTGTFLERGIGVGRYEPSPKAMLLKVMEYPKEAIARAMMGLAKNDPVTVEVSLLLAELQRQRELEEAENRRFEAIPETAVSMKRYRYHLNRLAMIRLAADNASNRLTARLGVDMKGGPGDA